MTQRLTSRPIPKSDKVIPEAVPYKGSFRDPQGCPLSLFFLLFLVVLDLCCCVRGFLQLRKEGTTLRCGVGSHCSSFSYCRTQAVGTWASAAAVWGLSNSGSWALGHWLSTCGAQGLLALQHVGSFLTWDGTHDPCIGRPTLNH